MNPDLPPEIISHIIDLCDWDTQDVFFKSAQYFRDVMSMETRIKIETYNQVEGTINRLERVRKSILKIETAMEARIAARQRQCNDDIRKIKDAFRKQTKLLRKKNIECFCGKTTCSDYFHNHIIYHKYPKDWNSNIRLTHDGKKCGERFYSYYVAECFCNGCGDKRKDFGECECGY